MKISSLKELKKISNTLSKIIIPGDSIFLYGEIGVGKTTFTRYLINSIEFKNKLKKSEILSPTFNIVFEYNINDFTIKHFDLYRLKNENEVENIGLFKYSDKTITVIEWPEQLKKKPINRIEIFFKYSENMTKRSLIVKKYGRLKKNDF